MINACYAAGFRAVTRGVIGDELVAAEYLRLWEEEPWGTLIRSTDPVVVETVRTQYPELVPYLAPVTMPAVAEARYLRALYGTGLRVVYAGICPPGESPDLDAAITFGDLEQLFRIRGVTLLAQPTLFERVPEERRRHLSAAGGMPLALLEESRHTSRRFRKVRGSTRCRRWRGRWRWTGWISASWTSSRPRGRWTIRSRDRRRSCTGGGSWWRAPSRRGAGSRWWTRRWWRASGRRSRSSRGGSSRTRGGGRRSWSRSAWGRTGEPWDCRACGFDTCRRFAEAAALGRASMRQCPPYQERRANEAQRAAAVDAMTGLRTYRVLRERLAFEVERSKRSNEGFAVLFLDLDRFKEVNDQYGHEAGNEILRAVAGEIRNAVRASDVAAGTAVTSSW